MNNVLYFILSMVAGFFLIAIPWSGIILIITRREKSNPEQNTR